MSEPENELTAEQDAIEHSLQERVYRNQRIQDVAAMQGWQDICDVVKERLASAQNRLAFGQVSSIEEYRSVSGEAQALLWVLQIPETVQALLNEARKQAAEDREAQEDDDE